MITRTRFSLTFHAGPVKGPNKWRGRNRVRSEWVYDVFKDGERVVAVRCYKCSQHGCESRLIDGWLARGEEHIAKHREELKGLLASPYVMKHGTDKPETYDGRNAVITLENIKL